MPIRFSRRAKERPGRVCLPRRSLLTFRRTKRKKKERRGGKKKSVPSPRHFSPPWLDRLGIESYSSRFRFPLVKSRQVDLYNHRGPTILCFSLLARKSRLTDVTAVQVDTLDANSLLWMILTILDDYLQKNPIF